MNSPLQAPTSFPLDSDAFKYLYQEYQGFVYRRAYYMLSDQFTAEDVTQNTFMQVYRNLHRYRGGALRIWLFRIATNACYDELRRRSRQDHLHPVSIDSRSDSYNQIENLVSSGFSPEEAFDQIELSAAIQHCNDPSHTTPENLSGRLSPRSSQLFYFLYRKLSISGTPIWQE